MASPQDNAGREKAAPPSSRLARLAVAGGVVLVIAGGAVFYLASRKAPQPAPDDAITVTITGKTCDPNELTVPAGRRTFRIVNNSDRTVEWEILDGVMVVEERENIAPGFSSTLTARLDTGTFQITCGLLSNPRGTLTVTPSADAGNAARPALTAFIGPLAEYRVYLALESGALTSATADLAAAVRDGDLARARALYVPARALYRHIEPAAQRFVDLDAAISARADYLEKREADPAFTGFHRLEYGLFAQGDLAGLTPVAERLLADVTTLEERLGALQLPPERMADGARTLLTRWAGSIASEGEERYSGTDIDSLAATLAGAGKVIGLLQPLVAKADPALATETQAKLDAAVARIDGLRGPQGYARLGDVSREDRAAIAASLQALADATGKLNASIGLE
ncbi:iron uptake system protein EfeO [Pseudochelatococcus lubricantis]|uniref:iron uptake system protein EfeO n=1 Tax=Pseudochelatococcus lubricantis TaxID=1538102 RepID=UPI0035E757DB